MKKTISSILVLLYVDSLFRRLNNNKLLIVTYHGICEVGGGDNLFTQLPVDVFSSQIKLLKKIYNILSLKEVLRCVQESRPFPSGSAMITFDDGFMSNFSLAYPVLKELNIPATIFLTVDYIGTRKLLWFDELFLFLKQAIALDIDLSSIDPDLEKYTNSHLDVSEVYSGLGGRLKRQKTGERERVICKLKEAVGAIPSREKEAFRLLTWEQVLEMFKSGLIDFGVHTATHRIVSDLHENEWEQEIVHPKKKLEQILECKVESFCYPNGIPDIDFSEQHEKYLKKFGYQCAFSTGEWLNSPRSQSYRLGRIPAGNDMTSDRNYFKLNTSGFIETVRKFG